MYTRSVDFTSDTMYHYGYRKCRARGLTTYVASASHCETRTCVFNYRQERTAWSLTDRYQRMRGRGAELSTTTVQSRHVTQTPASVILCGVELSRVRVLELSWYGGRPRPRRHCVRWGPSSPTERGSGAPSLFGPFLLWICGQTVAHLCN